jgi:hypothetical protein
MNKGIRAFHKNDPYMLSLLDAFSGDELARSSFIQGIEMGCSAYTIVKPGSDAPLACLGGQLIYSKVLQLWALVDRAVTENPLYYARQTKRLSDLTFDRLDLNRIQFHARCDQEWVHRWANFLGYTLEARCKRYGEDGMDYFLFAKVRG